MNGFYDVNRSQLDQAAGEAVIAVRSSFERVGILAAWLTDNPAPTAQTDPLVVEHGYTEDEAYLMRRVFQELDVASEGIEATMEIARKLTGLR